MAPGIRSLIYGHDDDAFLELQPDEVAAAIMPTILVEWNARSTQRLVSRWNLLNGARHQHGDRVAAIVSEAWQWLVGEGFLAPNAEHMGEFAVTRRGQTINLANHVMDARAMGLLRSTTLGSQLAEQVLPIFRHGQYDIAVFAAFREVEDRVRHESGLAASGVSLMGEAFKPAGPLRDPALDAGEAVARMILFQGAMGVHRNATGHAIVNYADPQEAVEAVLLANDLLRHLARAVAATRHRGRPRRRASRTP